MDRRDTAVKILRDIKQFYKRLYYFPDKAPFNGEDDFKAACAAVDEVTELINDIITDAAKGG